MKRIYIILMIVSFSALAAAQEVVPVKNVDLNRYVGKWFEIARYPNRFQKQCVSDVTANYKIKENGRIEVANQCKSANGKIQVAIGEGKVVDPKSGSKLKVAFAPPALRFLPFVWADYWIIDLDPDYKYAAVGTPNRDYLWILSRTPEMDQSTYDGIIDRISKMGFKPNLIEKTPQGK